MPSKHCDATKCKLCRNHGGKYQGLGFHAVGIRDKIPGAEQSIAAGGLDKSSAGQISDQHISYQACGSKCTFRARILSVWQLWGKRLYGHFGVEMSVREFVLRRSPTHLLFDQMRGRKEISAGTVRYSVSLKGANIAKARIRIHRYIHNGIRT
ncbi:hypothetical protein K504DRAFT_453528 [Pleomassaria siparia CBS 279.74]|uniref:Uncharacterized protein n=1 Tax=Pleomassaria siparia CBS 279.74 TaxID=1314801 RepID=A0A6G1KGH0_9PLEO|nr:hypothetical protein K504DRAFT_453528 [Pleomassaria siparia CBS 279.74]